MQHGTFSAACALALMAPAAAQTALPFTPPSTPFDNALARVQLSAGPPDVVTPPHTHPTNRVMIYFEAGTNTIRFPDGTARPEHFGAGDVQWNDAMGTHTATITAPAPVDIIHVELKSPPGMVPAVRYPARDPRAVDPGHFKVEIENNQVRVLRLRLAPGEKTPRYDEAFEHLVVPLTAALLKRRAAGGPARIVTIRQAEPRWLPPGAQADENAGATPYQALIVEFRK